MFIQKMKNYGLFSKYFCQIFVVTIILVFIISCKKNKNTVVRSDSYSDLMWFKNDSNYKNIKNYQDRFQIKYDKEIKAKQYEKAKLLLYFFGKMTIDFYTSDRLYIKNAEEYLTQNYNVKKDTTLTQLNFYLGYNYLYGQVNTKKGLFYAQKAIEANKEMPSTIILIKAYKLIANCYVESGQHKKAITVFTELLPIAEKENNLNQLGSIYYNIGYTYELLYAYNESDKAYEKAALFFLKAKNTGTYIAQKSYHIVTKFNNTNDTIKAIKNIDSLLITSRAST